MSDVEGNADMSAGSIDPGEFRRVLGHFPSGVTVVTSAVDGDPAGMTIQSFTSVSLAPPLVAFVPGIDSTSWIRMQESDSFCVNILTAQQQDLCMTMASKDDDKFAGIEWEAGVTGSPVLAGSLAWLECERVAIHHAGDHDLVIGRVVNLQTHADGDELDPMLFYKGGFGTFG